MLLVGDILEIRIFSEWIPYLAVCLSLIAYHRLAAANQQQSSSPRTNTERLTAPK